ncbi:hypothetical protein C4561_03025 [candidate division WWE3 bacterium]|uniref:Uncharacterized protein n=1 Tax=candidate division WWE3 bacterium TaxID=2053526 RepID=A0A3A4ZD05_UNCKA|nr:MAG: hypothetical protein C4561_03025 [candidate division WWE3 bacterium]
MNDEKLNIEDQELQETGTEEKPESITPEKNDELTTEEIHDLADRARKSLKNEGSFKVETSNANPVEANQQVMRKEILVVSLEDLANNSHDPNVRKHAAMLLNQIGSLNENLSAADPASIEENFLGAQITFEDRMSQEISMIPESKSGTGADENPVTRAIVNIPMNLTPNGETPATMRARLEQFLSDDEIEQYLRRGNKKLSPGTVGSLNSTMPVEVGIPQAAVVEAAPALKSERIEENAELMIQDLDSVNETNEISDEVDIFEAKAQETQEGLKPSELFSLNEVSYTDLDRLLSNPKLLNRLKQLTLLNSNNPANLATIRRAQRLLDLANGELQSIRAAHPDTEIITIDTLSKEQE